VPKPSSLENEHKIKIGKNNLAFTQVNLPVQGIFDFAKFNFSRINDVFDGAVLTPFNLPKRVKLKLHKLCIKQNWNNDDDIFQNLNIPSSHKIKHSPFNYKYVFDYVSTHKTFIYDTSLCVNEDLLLTPVDEKDFKLFYLI
jgi:hypothetical protein